MVSRRASLAALLLFACHASAVRVIDSAAQSLHEVSAEEHFEFLRTQTSSGAQRKSHRASVDVGALLAKHTRTSAHAKAHATEQSCCQKEGAAPKLKAACEDPKNMVEVECCDPAIAKSRSMKPCKGAATAKRAADAQARMRERRESRRLVNDDNNLSDAELALEHQRRRAAA